MVEPFLIIGGIAAGAYFLGKKKETPKAPPTPEEVEAVVEEKVEEMVVEAAPEKIEDCEKVPVQIMVWKRPPPSPKYAEYLEKNREVYAKQRELAAQASPTRGIVSQPVSASAISVDLTALRTEYQAVIDANSIAHKKSFDAFQARQKAFFQKYANMGYKKYTVVVIRGSERRKRIIVTYICPPGKLPIQWQAQIKQIVDLENCTVARRQSYAYSRTFNNVIPSEVQLALKKKGWKEHKKIFTPIPIPMQSTSIWKSVGITHGGEPVTTFYLCPPGKLPK